MTQDIFIDFDDASIHLTDVREKLSATRDWEVKYSPPRPASNGILRLVRGMHPDSLSVADPATGGKLYIQGRSTNRPNSRATFLIRHDSTPASIGLLRRVIPILAADDCACVRSPDGKWRVRGQALLDRANGVEATSTNKEQEPQAPEPIEQFSPWQSAMWTLALIVFVIASFVGGAAATLLLLIFMTEHYLWLGKLNAENIGSLGGICFGLIPANILLGYFWSRRTNRRAARGFHPTVVADKPER